MGRGPDPGSVLQELMGFLEMSHPFVLWGWPGSVDVTSGYLQSRAQLVSSRGDQHSPSCALFILTPGLSHLAPSAPPRLPEGACLQDRQDFSYAMCRACGTQRGHQLRVKCAPLQGALQSVFVPSSSRTQGTSLWVQILFHPLGMEDASHPIIFLFLVSSKSL